MLKACLRAGKGSGSSPAAFLAPFLFAALSQKLPALEAPALSGFSLSGTAKDGVYTRATPQGLVIAGEGMLIIEEADSSSRPVLRIEWKDGEERAVTRWEYSADGMYPCVRITTLADSSSVRAAFNADGMETERVSLSSEGTALSRARMDYAPATGDRGGYDLMSLTEETFSPSGEVVSSERTAYSYNDDGSVKTQAIYQNGVIAKLIRHGEENSRTETVFHEGKELFTAEYRDGERVRAGRRERTAAAEER